MNEINEALSRLKTTLYEDELIKEYFRVKDLVFNDPYLLKLEETLKELQKEITKNVLNEVKHKELTKEYQKCKEDYDSHPYVVNYNSLLSDVNELLQQLKSIIE